jgi:hypothetical protein
MIRRIPSALSQVLALALAAAVGVSVGCGGDGLSRGAVAGRVTLGGQPLAKGRILFLPLAPNQGPTVSASIVDGSYRLLRHEGPVIGRNRVEVEAEPGLGFSLDDEAAFARRSGRPLPPNPVPVAFNRRSTLVCDVQAGEDNQFDIAIPAAAHVAAKPRY